MTQEPRRSDADSRWGSRLRRLGAVLAKWGRALEPGPRVRRGAGRGVIAVTAVLALGLGYRIRPGLGPWLDPVAGVLIALALAAVAGVAAALLFQIVRVLPRLLGWSGLAAAGAAVVVLMLMGLPAVAAAVTGITLIALQAIFGGALAGARRVGPRGAAVRVVAIVVSSVGLAANALLIYWMIDRGSDDHLRETAAAGAAVEPLLAADPSRPGAHEVQTLFYGSGTDRHRPEFGHEVDVRTEPVDASPFVEDKGWRTELRRWYWGFDRENLPVNGRVWYPDGAGPFPLVLIVHGNHAMWDYSDPGYAYLGELLASRGFITVSVDENFFNSSTFSPMRAENDGRAWMLLQHLSVWREWNGTPGNPFHGRVDLSNLALIGHSRGGEAAAIAGAFNRLPRYPDDATVEFDFDFDIRAIVAIAPSDMQYEPAGRPTPLSDVNYLVFQGAHDADVAFFAGARQYHRVRFTDDAYRFKASLWAYRANHGQFNTGWGDADFPWPLSVLLNRSPLLPPEDQRRIAEVYISGLLEATLHGDRSYVPLFRDARAAASWLPTDTYIARFRDSSFRLVADYEEDVDVSTASLEGASIRGEHLSRWREEDLPFRRQQDGDPTKENTVVILGWQSEEPPASYSVALPEELSARWALGPRSLLVFSLAQADEDPVDPDPEDEDGDEEDEERPPVDLTVELVAADGTSSRLPLSRFGSLVPPSKSRFLKLPNETDLYGDPWEPPLATFELPLRTFAEETPGFDPAALRTIRFVFDRSPSGVLILDEIGFAEPSSGSPNMSELRPTPSVQQRRSRGGG